MNNLFKVAGLIALITIFSKLVGFGRDVVAAHAYGTSLVIEAYNYSYQIPAFALILLGGLGGPFHTATVAIFSSEIDNIGSIADKDRQSLLNSFLTLTAIVFFIISILVFFFSDQIIYVIANKATPQLHHLAALQLKIMSPIMFIGGLIGILYGISNVYKEFLFTSLSPTVASIALIIAIYFFNGTFGGSVLAWGTLIGAIGQLVLQLPVFLKSGFRYKPEFKFFDPRIKKILNVLLPAMVSTTIGQANIYVDMFFTSWLVLGAWSAINYANRIFQFPVGIIMTAMLVPLFPMFASFVAKKDMVSLREYFHKGINSLWFLSFPILAFIILYSFDGIKLIFEKKHFTHHDTIMVSWALIYLTFSIIPYVARDTLTRIFYAFGDSKTPFKVAVFSILTNFIFDFAFIKHLGIGAITLSTTAVTAINCIILAILIKKKTDLDYLRLRTPALKMFIATMAMVAVGLSTKLILNHFISDTSIYLAAKLCVYTVVCTITYFTAAILLKLNIAFDIFKKVKTKFIKAIPPLTTETED
ncbi:MAG: murein biosynthesis integral membrane protein MurJ [bacterium]